MNEADKYFDRHTFPGLVMVMPATVILLSIILRLFNINFLIIALFDIKKYLNPYYVMNVFSLFSLLICFADIVRVNKIKIDDEHQASFIGNKSFTDLAVITVNLSYVLIIYLFWDLDKLGNIPIGSN